jgi:beta-glucosidase
VTITNSGNRSGKEVVQLYIGDSKSSLPRPLKELKGFEKVELQPGESKSVTFTISKEELSFYDDRVAEWCAEPGKFTLYVGSSSSDVRLTKSFKLR